MKSDYQLILIVSNEVHSNICQHLHPSVSQLVSGFIKYLKEPRYQSPLTLSELSRLFQSFYQDLNSLIINIYTQSNSNKRNLLSNSQYFGENPKDFDYLLAIANYSSSSIKLSKRSDPEANLQLRVFNFYKFLIIFESIERAQFDLFNSCNNPSDDNEIILYNKIFKFDEKDIAIQSILDEKLTLLKNLNLPFTSLSEGNDESIDKLNEFFKKLSPSSSILSKIIKKFNQLNDQITPFAKLKCIVKIQKYLIILLSEIYDNDLSKINNDILLPSLIYIIIHYSNSNNLYLNFTFIQNFINLIDPYKVDASIFTLNSSFSSYKPNNYRFKKPSPSNTSLNQSSNQASKKLSNNLYQLLNLNESSDFNQEEEDCGIDFFNNDKDLINYIQANYLNNGELYYYLTNFEAILFFLQNVTIDELPDIDSNDEILIKPIHKLVEVEEIVADQPKSVKSSDDLKKVMMEEFDETRSRSSSLLNTISTKFNDATSFSTNRSRSNSASIFNNKNGSKEVFPSTGYESNNTNNNFENSIMASPILSNDSNTDENSSLTVMKNILNRFSSVSVLQFRPTIDGALNDLNSNESNHRRSSSLINKLSPNHSRTRSSSLEQMISNNPLFNATSTSSASNPTSGRNNSTSSTNSTTNDKRNSITSKFTYGVSEFMTKLNSPVTQNPPNIIHTNPKGHKSSSSLHSLPENDDNDNQSIGSSTIIQKRPDYNHRNRTSSLQIMDKWFNNLSTNTTANSPNKNEKLKTSTDSPNATVVDNTDGMADSESNEVSLFSNSYRELTKYQNIDFDSLTISDLRNLKNYYDQLCNDLNVNKLELKTSDEDNDERKNIDIL